MFSPVNAVPSTDATVARELASNPHHLGQMGLGELAFSWFWSYFSVVMLGVCHLLFVL